MAELSHKSMEMLLNFDYPGNVRELENILEHALIVSKDDIILPQHLPGYLRKQKEPAKTAHPNRQSGEKEQILAMLEKHNWHKGNTAQALGVNRSTLWRKMKRHRLIS